MVTFKRKSPHSLILALGLLFGALIDAQTVPLPNGAFSSVILAPWGHYYAIDDLSREVVLFDAGGEVKGRYGGFGRGPHALKHPVALAVEDNHLYLLDRGAPAIVQLDRHLNPIGRLPLSEQILPLDFVRDAKGMFWVVDGTTSELQILQSTGQPYPSPGWVGQLISPELIATDGHRVAVWDRGAATVVVAESGGGVLARYALDPEGAVDALAIKDDLVMILANGTIHHADGAASPFSGAASGLSAYDKGWIIVTGEGRQLLQVPLAP